MMRDPRRPLKGMAVMVVEDEVAIALGIEHLLTELGCCELHSAARVEHAMQVLDHLRPDAAVLDVNLHGEMVFPVGERLDQLDVPFVIVTGYNSAAIPKKWLHRVVRKPYDLGDLAQLIREIIVTRQRLRERETLASRPE